MSAGSLVPAQPPPVARTTNLHLEETRMFRSPALASIAVVLSPLTVHAQTFGANFANDYSFVDLGSPSGVPTQLGGIVFKPGDLNTLWIGGAANSPIGAIYEIAVTRDPQGHITAFSGASTQHAPAPYIDGGLVFGPTGVLFFTGYPVNTLGEIKPGSTTVDKTITLTPLGVGSSVGAIQFVPAGFAGAGGFKILGYNTDEWYTADLVADASGTFDVANVQLKTTLVGGLEGVVYVHGGNPGFTNDSVLACEYSTGEVGAYEIDANGDPVLASRQDFMTGLTGAEGALIDPVTGDFIFSTFGGGNRVLVVRGFSLPTVYCTPKASSLGCIPGIGYTGQTSVSGPDNFAATAQNVFNRKYGILLFGTTTDDSPFHGGTLCVASPTKLSPVLNSGGSPLPTQDCTGTFSYPLTHAFMASHNLTPGTAGYVQFMIRDPGFAAPDNVALTGGLRFVVLP
jgi:hypothetical protein